MVRQYLVSEDCPPRHWYKDSVILDQVILQHQQIWSVLVSLLLKWMVGQRPNGSFMC
jgi:hypothetical protein